MLLSHPNSNILATCNILLKRSLDWVQKHWTLYLNFFFFFNWEHIYFPKIIHLFLKYIWRVNTKLSSPIRSVFEFCNYLQKQRVGCSTLLCTGLSRLPRCQWQILLVSNKKKGQQLMVFIAHTQRFQILLAKRHYPALFLWRRGRGEQFLANGTY